MGKKSEAKISTSGKRENDSPGHSKHLCAVIAGGFGFKQVHELVGSPKFICAKCGRAAEKKRNLCKARKL